MSDLATWSKPTWLSDSPSRHLSSGYVKGIRILPVTDDIFQFPVFVVVILSWFNFCLESVHLWRVWWSYWQLVSCRFLTRNCYALPTITTCCSAFYSFQKRETYSFAILPLSRVRWLSSPTFCPRPASTLRSNSPAIRFPFMPNQKRFPVLIQFVSQN